MIVFQIVKILFVIYLIYILIKTIFWALRSSKITSNIPGPKTWPIIGNIHLFYKMKSAKDGYTIITKLFNKYGHPRDKIMKLWIGPKLVFILGNPMYIQVLLRNQNATGKGDIYEYFSPVIKGIFGSNGKEWQELRKPLNKLLTKKVVLSNFEIINEKILNIIKILDKFSRTGEQFDIKPILNSFTLQLLCKSHFGFDLNETYSELADEIKNIESGVEYIFNKAVYMPTSVFKIFIKVMLNGQFIRVWRLANKVIDERKTKIEKLGVTTEDINSDIKICNGDNLIKKAIDEKLSWEDTGKLIGEIIVAGFHTTGVTLSCTILLLAMHPEYQESVYKELLNILGDNPNLIPTWQDLSRMTYLDRVIKEVLRHHSPPTITRSPSEDIDFGDFIIPKGCAVTILINSLHKDPDYWSHPDQFYPDHFLPEEVDKRPKGSFIPFSWGPRICPGYLYATITMKYLLSALIRMYKFETDLTYKQLEYEYLLMVDIKNGYPVRIKPRNAAA